MKVYMEKKKAMEAKLQFFVKQPKVEICVTNVEDGHIEFSISGPKVEFERAAKSLSTFKSIEKTAEPNHDEELAETFGYYKLILKKSRKA